VEKNFYDRVLENMFSISYGVKRELRQKFQKTNPPRMVQVSPQRMIEEYQNLSLPQINALKTVYGEDAYNGYIDYMNKLMAGAK
jgi:hypothetical protein